MGQELTKVIQLTGRILSRGFLDLFRNRRAAVAYWRRIIKAALSNSENAFTESLGLPSYNINQITHGAESIPITIVDYQYTYGDIPLDELLVLCKIVRYRQPQIVFEIGTYLGGTTLQMAANTKAKIYTLDLPPRDHKDYTQPKVWDPESDVYPDQPGVRFHGTPYERRIIQLFGNSQTFDFTPYYGVVDFIFVDGCHHYDFVVSDSKNALKMMSSGGIVVWHDYAPYSAGVLQGLNELSREVPLAHIHGTSLVFTQQKG